MDGSASVDEGRLQVSTVYSGQSGLRRARCGPRYRTEFHAHFRCRTARCEAREWRPECEPVAISSLKITKSLSAQQQQQLPSLIAARRPKDLPGCKRRVCRGERYAQPLADNQAPSIGSPEIRQSP